MMIKHVQRHTPTAITHNRVIGRKLKKTDYMNCDQCDFKITPADKLKYNWNQIRKKMTQHKLIKHPVVNLLDQGREREEKGRKKKEKEKFNNIGKIVQNLIDYRKKDVVEIRQL